jgi:hypothetical protein
MIKELTTKYGLTYIGQFVKLTTECHEYKDVMMVSMKPVKVADDQYNMVPALDVVNVFSDDSEFKFSNSDVIYEGEVKYKNFIKLYQDTLQMYQAAKIKHGTFEEPTTTDISVQKK